MNEPSKQDQKIFYAEAFKAKQDSDQRCAKRNRSTWAGLWNHGDSSVYFQRTKLTLGSLLSNRKDMFNEKKAKAKLAQIMVHFRLIAITAYL